jgi:DNA-binding MarR family transcriptional regulator
MLPPRDAQVRITLDAVRRIVRELREGSIAVEKRLGISSAQLFVLRTLAEEPGASLNDVALRTMTHQSSVSVVVRKLIEQGLVSRRRAASDSRRSELSLTAQGRALLKRAPALPQQRLIDATLQLSKRDRSELARCLSRLVDCMGIGERPPQMLFENQRAASGASSQDTRRR